MRVPGINSDCRCHRRSVRHDECRRSKRRRDGVRTQRHPVQIAGCAWSIDAAGDFDDPTRWTGGSVPGSGSNAVIDFADDPQVLHAAGTDTVASLTNMAGDFVMVGGTLTAATLTNDSAMSWTGGSLS